MTWHVPDELLERYATLGLRGARLLSIEAHIASCGDCRKRLARSADRSSHETVWAGVERRLAPPGPWTARLKRAVGERHPLARLALATPTLRGSWFLAVTLVLILGIAIEHAGVLQDRLFLLIAPLLPVLGTAIAYGPRIDPTYDIVVSAPIPAYRVLLVRSVAVLTSTTGLTLALPVVVPGADVGIATWLLPSLALTSGGLALTTAMTPFAAAATVSGVWISTTIVLPLLAGSSRAGAPEVALVEYAIGGAACIGLFAVRRDRLETATPSHRLPVHWWDRASA